MTQGELSLVCKKCGAELENQQIESKLCSTCLRNKQNLQLGLISIGLSIVFFVVGLPFLIIGIIYSVVTGFSHVSSYAIFTVVTINFITPTLLLTFGGMFLAFGIRKLQSKPSRIISFKLSLVSFLFGVLLLVALILFFFDILLPYFDDLYILIIWSALFFVTGIIAFFIDKRNMQYS